MNPRLKLKVGQAEVVPLKFFKDSPDGNLFIAEACRQIPFEIKRVYFINNLANSRAVRGRHAHRRLEQVLICVSGSFVLHLDDGRSTQRIRLNDAACGIRVGPMLWHTMSSFSYDCVILVLASAWFEESDYIRDHGVFLQAVQRPQASGKSRKAR
jgi:dTDP-4-dehydrorhamnose 3,5-epimerase-like enzyme